MTGSLAKYAAVDESPASAWSEQLRGMGVEVARSRRVLLVDDEPDNVEVLAALLEDDFEVHVAHSGQAALKVFDEVGDFAAVLSDQRMPGMTGVELLAELRRRAPATVRMVITAYSDLPPIIAAVNEGHVYRMFLKPWDPDEMRAAVADAVWVHEAERALNGLVELLATRKRELAATVQQLKRSQNELLAAERMSTIGRFAAGITHNIRNSLTVMMHLVDTVRERPTEEGLVRSAQHALQTLDALLQLANDVSALARGRMDSILAGKVAMGPFLERVVKQFAGGPLGADHPVSIRIAPNASVLCFDNGRVEKAMVNLLRGAAHASAPGTPLALIVHPIAHGEACVEIAPRGATGAEGRSVGSPQSAEIALGLEIARVVAEAHGGRLAISPRPAGDALELWLAGADPEVR
jgi:CheY-like chemotaxis protein